MGRIIQIVRIVRRLVMGWIIRIVQWIVDKNGIRLKQFFTLKLNLIKINLK